MKSTGYPLHSPVSPSLLLPCVTVCHHISTGVYFLTFLTHTHTHTQIVSYFLRKSTQPYFSGCPKLQHSLMSRRFHGLRTSSATIRPVYEVPKNPPFSIFYTDQNSVFISNFSYACHLCQNKPDPGQCIQSSRCHIQVLSLSLLHIIRPSPKRCVILPNTTAF